MAIFHGHGQIIGRSNGRSAVSAAAYRSGSKLMEYILDKKTGLTGRQVWDYRKKLGVVFSKIYAPEHAPDWVYDRETLWNRVTAQEKRKDGQLAREFDIALPVELTEEQNKELMEEIVKECYVKHGMIADANLHLDNPANPHCHIMLSMRNLVEKLDGTVDFGIKNREWNTKAFLLSVREQTAAIINKHLEFYGHLARVSHLSHKARGIDLIPSIKIGAAYYINHTERKELHAEIIAENAKMIAENPELVFSKLSINSPVFTKEDIAIVLHNALLEVRDDQGKVVDSIEETTENQELASEFMIAYSKLMNSDKISLIVEEDLKGRALYALSKRVELEHQFVEVVDRLNNSNKHVLPLIEKDLEADKDSANRDGSATENSELTEEQKKAVLEILNGPDIVALQGLPGAGKTTVMKEVVRQYKKAGKEIIGLSTSANAAANLGELAGIPAMNIDKFRKNMQTYAGEKFELGLRLDFYNEQQYSHGKSLLTDQHILIVDEASMIELSRNHYLNLAVEKAGAKIIKLGDNNQLPAIGAAGAFSKECDIVKVSYLSKVRRQKNPEHAKATQLLAQYDIEGFLQIYEKEGSIKLYDSSEQAQAALINDYIDAYIEKANELEKDHLVSDKDRIVSICAHSNKVVTELNHLARAQLKQAGILKGQEVTMQLGGRSLKLTRGEQVIFGQNSKKLGVLNGEVGTILSVKQLDHGDNKNNAIITVRVSKADGSSSLIKIDSREQYSYKAINYGYAVTAYKLQGATIDQVFVYGEPNIGYEGFNVMMTRHRDRVILYAVTKELEDVVYRRIGEDAELARELHNITSNQPLWRIGLSLSMHKRANVSLATDYVNMGLSKEDKILKSYIESREDLTKTIREIITWQERQLKLTARKPGMWEHKSWPLVMLYQECRNKSAEVICGNYLEYKHRIIQLNLNYQTIKKHAGLEEIYKVDKLAQHNMLGNLEYRELINDLKSFSELDLTDVAIEKMAHKVTKSFKLLKQDILERHIDIEALEVIINDISSKRYILEDNINYLERNNKLLPEFLIRIYKNKPSEILANWQELVERIGVDQAAKNIVISPKILGDLKGIGIGNWLGFNDMRKDAIANSSEIGNRLKAYYNATEEIAEYQQLLADERDLTQDKNLITEHLQLKSLLPNRLEQKLIDQIDKVLGNSQQLESLYEIASSDFVQDEILAMLVKDTLGDDYLRKQIDQQNNALARSQKPRIIGDNRSSTLVSDNHSILAQEGQESMGHVRNRLRPRRKRKSNNPLYNRAKEPGEITYLERSVISFDGIRQAITSDDFERLFRNYAQAINPDGVSRKQGSNMLCGSLTMSLTNGLWYRHSTGDKGDIFHFVSQATGKNKQESLELIARELNFTDENGQLVRLEKSGEKVIIDNIIQLQDKDNHQSAEEWVALKIVPQDVPTFNADQHLAYMLKEHNLIATYQYRNSNNQLIGCALRLVNKESDKKQVLPLSYCFNEGLNKHQWRLKVFTDELGLKPIYGIEKLTQDKPIVIVEGEKTADIAQELLPEYNVISWLGGSKAASNVNWQILEGKNVIIWPDNDQPGFAAARIIQQKVNAIASSCLVVDPRILGVPNKWDLGDTIPANVNIRSALVTHNYPISIEIVDQQIGALEHRGFSNEQLISVLGKAAITALHNKGKNDERYLNRLHEELQVISKTGFAEDFTIAANIAKYCEHMNIPMGPGRGSAVSSLVAYSLSIHKIDPIEYNLLFERFLTEKTVTNPDFDFDIATSKKILVENYLLAKYSNATKLAVINSQLDRPMSVHPAGIGIVPEDIKDQLPYRTISAHYWADRPMLAIDHKQAQQLGVKKFDLLSSQVTELLDKAEDLAKADWADIAWHDPQTFELIQSGDTDGVYQLASDFAKTVCQQVRIEKFDDLINILALIRPSTKSYIKYFSKNTDARSNFSDPKGVFKETKGIPLFQEQIMQASHYYLGIDKSETNQFRKELEKQDSTHILADKTNFTDTAIANGLDDKDAHKLYALMQEFSKFSYNKSHAVAYAQVTFKTAYLKVHYPEIFQEIFKIKGSDITLQKEPVIEESWAGQEYDNPLSNQVKEDLAYIRKYNVAEDKILAKFKLNNQQGMLELSRTVQNLQASEKMVLTSYSDLLVDIQAFGTTVDQCAIIRDLAGIPKLPDRSLYLQDLRIDALHEYITTKTNAFTQSKEQCGTIAELLNIVSAEQEFLGQLSRDHQEAMKFYGFVHYPLYEAAMIAEQKPGLMDDLTQISHKAKDQEVMTALEIIHILKSSHNAETIYKTIDQACEIHHITTNLASFYQLAAEAQTAEAMLSSIDKKQEFLSSLYGNLKYKDYEENLFASIKQADKYQKDNIVEQLHDVVQKALAKGVKTESQIVTCLRSVPDLAASYENLDRDCESHHIRINLEILAKTKEIAKTPEEILKAIGQKQEFLSSLHGNLKYNDYQPSLLNSIDQAAKQQKDMVMDGLHKATMHVIEHKIIQEQELMKHLQATDDPHMLEKHLRKTCEDHHIAYLHKNLDKLDNEEHVRIGDKLFSCKLEYIKHEIENPAHDFASTPRLTKIMKQYEHKFELEMQREMSGPSMSM